MTRKVQFYTSVWLHTGVSYLRTRLKAVAAWRREKFRILKSSSGVLIALFQQLYICHSGSWVWQLCQERAFMPDENVQLCESGELDHIRERLRKKESKLCFISYYDQFSICSIVCTGTQKCWTVFHVSSALLIFIRNIRLGTAHNVACCSFITESV